MLAEQDDEDALVTSFARCTTKRPRPRSAAPTGRHFDGKKTAILDEARTTKSKGAEMMKTYLDSDSDALDGFEFLTMAEAGEVGHWSVLQR